MCNSFTQNLPGREGVIMASIFFLTAIAWNLIFLNVWKFISMFFFHSSAQYGNKNSEFQNIPAVRKEIFNKNHPVGVGLIDTPVL